MESNNLTNGKPKNFAVIGAAGYVAPRHLQAIQETRNHLIAAVDPRDSAAILDQFSFDAKIFTEADAFERFSIEFRTGIEQPHLDYMSICSPNHLHYEHCRLAFDIGANVICEKPIVIDPGKLDLLSKLEQESGGNLFTVLQLRFHPEIIKLRSYLEKNLSNQKYEVDLTYIAGRGSWYHDTWKGQAAKSGGIVVNIGIHLFDILLWLFGSVISSKVYYFDTNCLSGSIDMERARVRWFLSIDKNDLPNASLQNHQASFRTIVVDDQKFDFSKGSSDLHIRIYQEILAGGGFRIDDARPSIELTHHIRNSSISPYDEQAHTLLNWKM